jgi:putative holliday junction resolvase
MICMGIDYGSRRIGIAISDPQATMALPLATIEVKQDNSHMARIRKLADDYQVERVVVGLPYNMDGTISEAGNKVMEWSRHLQTTLERPVILWDERLTTFEATGVLDTLNVKRAKRSAKVDQIAASLILKDYLNSLTR